MHWNKECVGVRECVRMYICVGLCKNVPGLGRQEPSRKEVILIKLIFRQPRMGLVQLFAIVVTMVHIVRASPREKWYLLVCVSV